MTKSNQEMRRAASKRSHSWWDSHISPKISKGLAENLEEMDQSVKRMLKLMEEDGDSLAKKAEIYYQKRPELISHVEDFYRMYRSLADRYDHVTGELRKNIPSELQSQGSGSEQLTPSPDQKPTPKSRHRAAGFNVFLGSGGSSDLSRKGSDWSSSSSDSGSESDEATSKGHLSEPLDDDNILDLRIFDLQNELKVVKEKLRATEEESSNALSNATENGNYDELQMKILELEHQLMVTNEKLQLSEEEITRLERELKNNRSSEIICDLEAELESSLKEKKILESELESVCKDIGSLEDELESSKKENKLLEAQLVVTNEKLQLSEEEITRLESELENNRSSEIICDLESELESVCKEIRSLEDELESSKKENKLLEAALSLEKKRMSEMQEGIMGLEADVATHDHTIEEMRVTMADVTKKYSQEKFELAAEISRLSKACATMEEKLREHDSKMLSLTDSIVQLEADKLEMQSEIDRANTERCKHVEELNQNLNALKLKYDMLVVERDETHVKVQALVANVSLHDDRIHEMDEHLHRLHLEHAQLIAGSENAHNLANELQVKVKELEEEVERQRAVIADNAEAKREAIRQLCFSLDHYRDGYLQLRQALHGHKWPTVMAS